MNKGFKGFRKPLPGPVAVSSKEDGLYLARLSGDTAFRAASGRSAVLKTVSIDDGILSSSEYYRRAGALGFDPAFARSGLFLHRGNKPAIFVALTRDEVGNYRAATDYSSLVGFGAVKAGEIVFPAAEAQTAEAQTAEAQTAETRKVRKGRRVAAE